MDIHEDALVNQLDNQLDTHQSVWPPRLGLSRTVRQRPASIVVAAFAALGAGTAAASGPIEEIQVTASRQARSVNDTPSALSVVAGEALQHRALATDALAFGAGTFLQQTTPGQGSVIVRGLKGSAVLHLVDGMRVNNALFRSAPTPYLALIPPVSIERIEVLRGPSTSLYGNDAMGGVVNILSRMPQFDSQTNSLRGDLAVFANTAERLRSVRASVEAGNADIAALASLEHLTVGDRRIGNGERVSPSGFRARAGRVALQAQHGKGQSSSIDFQYLEQPHTTRIDELVAGFGQSLPSSSEFAFDPMRRSFLHIRHRRKMAAMAWDFDASWQRIDDDRVTRDFGSNLRRHEDNRSDLIGIAANGTLETAHTSWSFGSEFYDDHVTSRRVAENLDSGFREVVAPRFPDDSRVSQGAVYVHAINRLSHRHSLQGGLRYSRFDIDLAATATDSTLKLDALTGDVGWLFHLTNGLTLTANIGRGMRAPNIFDLGNLGERPGNRFNIANPQLSAERIRQFDVGVKAGGTSWRFESSVFRLRYTDRITSVATGAITATGRDVVQSRNVAEADIWGVEIGGQLNLSERTDLRLALNYTRGDETEAGLAIVAADRIPPLSGRLQMRHRANEHWMLDAYIDFASDQNRLSLRDLRDPRIDPSGSAGWSTFNLGASFSPTEFWQYRVSVENAFNKRYRSHGSGIDAPGRNFAASIRRRW